MKLTQEDFKKHATEEEQKFFKESYEEQGLMGEEEFMARRNKWINTDSWDIYQEEMELWEREQMEYNDEPERYTDETRPSYDPPLPTPPMDEQDVLACEYENWFDYIRSEG